MKTVIKNNLFVLILTLLAVFIMGMNADSIFAGDETGNGIDDDESSWIKSGYMGDNEDVPWHVTSDWELIIGEEGKEYTYTQEVPANPTIFFYPWQLATIQTDQETFIIISENIRKVKFAGTVHLSGYCANMFYKCKQLEEVDFSGLDAAGITTMASMFNSCYSLKRIDFSGLDLHNATTVGGMFFDCRMLETADLSGFANSHLTSFQETFRGCTNLQSVNLSGIDTSGVTRMDKMFYNCKGLKSLDVSGFDTSSLDVEDGYRSSGSKDMFTGSLPREIALGSSTFPPDAGLNMYLIRVKTLDGEPVDGPVFNTISEYDGSAPGWYKISGSPGSGSGSEDGGSGTDSGSDNGSESGSGSGSGQGSDSEGSGGSGSEGSGSGSDSGVSGGSVPEGSGQGSDSEGSGGSGSEGSGSGSGGGVSGGEQNPGKEGSAGGQVQEGSGSDPDSDLGSGKGSSSEEGAGKESESDSGSGSEQKSVNEGSDSKQGSGNSTKENAKDSDTSSLDPEEITNVTITALSLKKTKYEYTGKRIRPAVSVSAGSHILRKGTDYTIKYSKNKAVGKARVTVTGKGRYRGSLSRAFRIVPDRVRIRVRTYSIVEGTQIKVSLSSKTKPAYYQLQISGDRKFRKIIAGKKFTKKMLLSGKIYAYKHLGKNRTYYIRVRLVKSGYKGRYSKAVAIKGRG